MKSYALSGKRIAVVATDGFEESELLEPKKTLEEAGARVEVLAPTAGEIRAWRGGNWGDAVPVQKTLHQANPEDYDAILLPGGVINADKLRGEEIAVSFITEFAESGRPIGVICHGAWSLIETGLVRDRRMTSWPTLRTDLENAGAIWVDEEAVVDNGWVSSRKPADIPAFCRELIEEIQEGPHVARASA